MTYLSSTKLGCKDVRVRKSEFVAKIPDNLRNVNKLITFDIIIFDFDLERFVFTPSGLKYIGSRKVEFVTMNPR